MRSEVKAQVAENHNPKRERGTCNNNHNVVPRLRFGLRSPKMRNFKKRKREEVVAAHSLALRVSVGLPLLIPNGEAKFLRRQDGGSAPLLPGQTPFLRLDTEPLAQLGRGLLFHALLSPSLLL